MLACVALGVAALLQNNCSYTDDFSTILRTTRRQDLNDVVPLMAQGGADPLPKSLQNVRLRLISDDGDQGDGFALDKAADTPTTDVAADESAELEEGDGESESSGFRHGSLPFEIVDGSHEHPPPTRQATEPQKMTSQQTSFDTRMEYNKQQDSSTHHDSLNLCAVPSAEQEE